jgi:hypothetical protein
MTEQKLFDIHIEVGYVGVGLAYAKTILGNNALEFEERDPIIHYALKALIDFLKMNGTFEYLIKKPSMAKFPFHQQLRTQNVTGVPHNHHVTPVSPVHNAKKVLFDLHIEMGDAVGLSRKISGANKYSRIALRNPFVEYIKNASSRIFSAQYLLVEILNNGVYKQLMAQPDRSIYPLPLGLPSSPSSSVATTSSGVAQKDIKRKLPSACIDVNHPACQEVCTSWDHFGKSKCQNICSWRKEV